MPSKTAKQAKFMRAACHSGKVRKSSGISKKVACEYVRADKGKSKGKSRRKR